MKTYIVTNKFSKDSIARSIIEYSPELASKSEVDFIFDLTQVDNLLGNYLLVIEDEIKEYVDIILAANLCNLFDEVVVCTNKQSAELFVNHIKITPNICTFDFKLGFVKDIYEDVSLLYQLIKSKFSRAIIIGYTNFESESYSQIGDQSGRLVKLFRTNSDSVYDKFGMSKDVLANIFRDKISIKSLQTKILDFQSEIGELKDELSVHKEIFLEELNNYKESDKFRNLSHKIIGKSLAIKKIKFIIEKLADTDATVLIRAESGTGKESVARAIHSLSKRSSKQIVALNCGSLNDNLLESELFGHEKGAFANAFQRRIGRFEFADRGTIFLDEIGDVSAAMQVKLLRVIQEGEFERVGGTRTIKTNVRIIAATNKNLAVQVREKTFREDLFYRLNVIPLTLPSLKERVEDIPILVEHFVKKHNSSIVFTSDAIDYLKNLSWKGNIRELENFVQQIIVFIGHNLKNSVGKDEIIYIQDKYLELLPEDSDEDGVGIDCSEVKKFLDKIELILVNHFSSTKLVTQKMLIPNFSSTRTGKLNISRQTFTNDELNPRRKCIRKLLFDNPDKWPTIRRKCRFINSISK